MGIQKILKFFHEMLRFIHHNKMPGFRKTFNPGIRYALQQGLPLARVDNIIMISKHSHHRDAHLA
jgi:hypothetical protein